MSEEGTIVPQKKGWRHYGYVIVVAGFLTQMTLLLGQRSLSLGLFEIQTTLGITAAEVGLISSYYGLVYAGAGFFWGWLSDKLGPRLGLSCAGIIVAFGLFMFGLLGANGLGIAIAMYTIVGLGCAGIYIATVPKLISAWFVPEKRGHAMRFVAPGGGITSMILGVAFPVIILVTSWQVYFMCAGGFAFLITCFFFFLIVDDPAKKNLVPVGSPPGTAVTPIPKQDRKKNEFAVVLKMPITWHIGVTYIVFQLAFMANSTFVVAIMRSFGYTPVQSGLGLTISSIGAICFMQAWGPMSDRLERKTVIAIACVGYALSGIAYCIVAMNSTPSLITCYVFTILLQGFFAITPVLMAAFGDYFPAEIRGTGNGVISTMSMAGRYGGPVLAGMAIDFAGGLYGYGFLFTGVMALIAGGMTLTWPSIWKKRRAEAAAAAAEKKE
ncbi:MAG: MFS transporter [Coriobacteriia bacterium]|nr:MFS transporter [Coriobacteriia bacterium]